MFKNGIKDMTSMHQWNVQEADLGVKWCSTSSVPQEEVALAISSGPFSQIESCKKYHMLAMDCFTN